MNRIRDRLAFLAAWLPYAVLVKAFWFVTDDAFISFRYSKNWALGHGLRYNLGDHVPVEGYSNFLWVMIGGVVEKLGGSIGFWMPLISFAAGSVLLYRVYRVLRDRFGLGEPLAAVVTLSLGTFAPLFVWSSGGLATVPVSLALFLMFERLILRDRPAGAAAGVAALAAALLRVEGIAWVVVIACGAVVAGIVARRSRLRAALTALAIAGAGFAVFLLWRHATYDSWVANTAAAKVGLSAGLLRRGLDYVAIHVLTFLTPLLLIPAWIGMLRRPLRPEALPLVGMSAAVFAYAVVVGGDFMAMSRLLVPGCAFNALLIGAMLQRMAGGAGPGSAETRGAEAGGHRRWPVPALVAGLAVTGIALLPVADIHLTPESARRGFNFRAHWNNYWTEIQYWNVMRTNADRWKRLGMSLHDQVPAGSSVVTPGIGYIGYYSGLTILDQAGLVDREIARRPTDGVTAPGHDKLVPPDWFLKDRPTIVSPYLVQEGAEMDRTLEELQRTADRFREEGADYAVTRYLLEGGPPRTVTDAEAALVANLLAPFRRITGPDRPREFVVFLRRSDS